MCINKCDFYRIMEPIIKLDGISRKFKVLKRHDGMKGAIKDLFSNDYNMIEAVKDVSFEINAGEIVGYLGPNGAGKSTTIKMMTGILTPSSGEIIANGLVPYKMREKFAKDIGVVFGQRTQLWWSLPVIESLKVFKDIYHVDEVTFKNNLFFFDDVLHCKDLFSKPVRELSLGQRTLCDILAALLHEPKILFLDEPTIGLDITMKAKIRELISAFNAKENTTVVLTSHDVGDIDALCKHIIIIDKGIKVFDDDIDVLKKYYGEKRILKIKIDGGNDIHMLNDMLHKKYVNSIVTGEINGEWIDIIVDETMNKIMEVLSVVQNTFTINDVAIADISTENVIRKIFEEG